MSSAPQKSHALDGSPVLYEFGWGAPPVAGIEPGAKYRAATLSPALIAMIAVLGSALLIVSYYKFFYKYCKSCPRRRGFESQDLEDGGMLFQDPEAWQIFNHTYGLDEAVIKSIPLYIFRKGEDEDKLWDGGLECSVCLLEFKEREALRVLPKCSHAFHVNCIDVWLRSHANCPLCRAHIVVNYNNNSNVGSCPFVPAMAARVRPNLEHGIAGVVHDSFRSDEESNNVLSSNSDGRRSTQRFSDVQSAAVLPVYEAAAEETFAENFEDLGAENFAFSKPVLTRSYSFGCSGNEHYSRNAEASFDSLLLTETAASASSPWKRAFKKFNSKSSGLFSLRSPFFNRTRGGSGSASSSYGVNNFSSMIMSPARDYSHRRYRRDFRHGGGSISRIRGGSLSPPILRLHQQSGRAQSMTSPLFFKRSSFSVFTPSRLRSGDPEALLSPDRFSNQP